MNPREEIKNIAPRLFNWEQKEGYRVPSGYFDNLSDTMIERAKEIENLEPYFQSLPQQVLNKIKQEDNRKIVAIRSFFKYGVAAALLIAVGTLVWTQVDQDELTSTYDVVDVNDELQYIVDEISMEDIFDSEFIDDELLDELFVSGDEQFSTDDSVEDLLFQIDDELLEEFL